MSRQFWEQVVAGGVQVPTGFALDDMTADLTRMLASSDPRIREELGFATLATWIHDGVYDDLLTGLGDGICAGLDVGLGEQDTTSVFQRSYSALVLTECIDRDNASGGLVSRQTLLGWGDRIATWLVRERDLRGFEPGSGYVHAIAHGADAIGALARSPRFGQMELVALLDIVGDRLLAPTEAFFNAGEDDRLAAAVLHLLRRDQLSADVVERWLARLAAQARPSGDEYRHPFHVHGNVQGFLRALHLQLALSPAPPAGRADLLLVLIETLRRTNREHLVAPRRRLEADVAESGAER